jgi:hypothetical protein
VEPQIIKIMEKIILSQLEVKDIIHENQRGFKPGFSTQNNLNDVIRISKNLL